jgi:hypothetical protein
MAQIMKYWKYPSKGTGFHSYQHDRYGTLSANFGTTYYNWESMPALVEGPNEAVATLMYHCGVAVEMEYNVADEGGSGSYVIKDPSGSYRDEQTVEYALTAYFGYSSTVQGIERAAYSDNAWKDLLKTELNAGRPIQYAGYGQGGHTFVCDGFDENDFFHINWGWGGYYDGFYMLDALNPGSGGIGSGAGSYNEDQQALIGIKPPTTSQTFQLEIYTDVSTDKVQVSYGEGFTISTDILNDGTAVFNGDYCAALFDANDVFIDYVEIKQGWSLNPGNHYTNGIRFTTEGLLSILPGKYSVQIFYRQSGGEWDVIVADKDATQTNDRIEIEVFNENIISLNSAISVLTSTIYSNGSLSVQLDVANLSTEDFTGILDVSLYNLDGEFVATVEEKTNVSLSTGSHFADGLQFNTDNVDVEPGTYLLALLHQWDGYDYELTGSFGTFINPVKVIVQEKPYEKDMYEDNDEINDAFPLEISYTSNSAHIYTTGSNFHIGNDWDFYSFELESGYSYEIDIRLNDSYSNPDGTMYSADALFLYSLDGDTWSETFDDVLPSKINAAGNTTLYCVVSPYFLGETGTYLLDLAIERSVSNSDKSIVNIPQTKVFPVPCNDLLWITCPENDFDYTLYDLNGKIVLQDYKLKSGTSLDISSFAEGIYMMNIKTTGQSIYRKIIKE